jgi:hypothetical protein
MTAIDCITLGKHCVGGGRLHIHERNSGPATRRQDNPKTSCSHCNNKNVQRDDSFLFDFLGLSQSTLHIRTEGGRVPISFWILLAEIRSRALAALIPPPRLCLSEWIERQLRLPEGVSALPGPCGSGPISAGSPTRSPIPRSSASSWSSRNPKRGEASQRLGPRQASTIAPRRRATPAKPEHATS